LSEEDPKEGKVDIRDEEILLEISRIAVWNTKREEKEIAKFKCPYCVFSATAQDELWCYVKGIEHLFYTHKDFIVEQMRKRRRG